jgi:hypothetical protein
MSMIDETAVENRRVRPDRQINAAPLAATPRWRLGQLLTATAGLVAVVAIGGAVIEAGMRARQPIAVAADPAPEKGSLVVASTTTVEAPVTGAAPAAEPDGSGSIDSKDKGAAEGGIETGSIVVTRSDEPPVTKPAAVPSDEKLDTAGESGKEIAKEVAKQAGADGPADAPVSTKAAHTEDPPVIAPAEDPPSEKASADTPPSLAPGSKAETAVSESAPVRIVRIVSDANMRAGPGKGEPVVAPLARGTAVELIACRHWCEVIVGGQRGWVYKDYVGESEKAQER